MVICSHLRPMVMVAFDEEFITRPDKENCFPVSYRCPTYGDFRLGRCTDCQNCKCQVAAHDFQTAETNLPVPFGLFGILNKTINTKEDLKYQAEQIVEVISRTSYMLTEIEHPYCCESLIVIGCFNIQRFFIDFTFPSLSAYTYAIELISESWASQLSAELILPRSDGKNYTVQLEMSNGPKSLFGHSAADGMQGPFEEGTFQYIVTSLGAARQAVNTLNNVFDIFAINLRYMSHWREEVREEYSSQLCPVLNILSSKERPEVIYKITDWGPLYGLYRVEIALSKAQCKRNRDYLYEHLKVVRNILNSRELRT